MFTNVPSESITYLLRRKFPDLDAIERALTRPAESSEQISKLYAEIKEYREFIELKSPDQIKRLVREEQMQETSEQHHRKREEDFARFFNAPSSTADFDYWSKAKYWTLDEAIALSFGRNPENVNWKSISPYTRISEFAEKYEKIRNLALRAKAWNELFDPVLPGLFIAWARRLDIDFPIELADKVIARGGNVADWKSMYDNLQKTQESQSALVARQEKLIKDFSKLTDDQSATIKSLRAKLQAVENELEQAKTAPLPKGNNLKTRERDTLLKIVIGMAVRGYSYKPNATKNTAPNEIAGDLETLGIAVSDDTIRKWLGEASGLLDGDALENL